MRRPEGSACRDRSIAGASESLHTSPRGRRRRPCPGGGRCGAAARPSRGPTLIGVDVYVPESVPPYPLGLVLLRAASSAAAALSAGGEGPAAGASAHACLLARMLGSSGVRARPNRWQRPAQRRSRRDGAAAGVSAGGPQNAAEGQIRWRPRLAVGAKSFASSANWAGAGSPSPRVGGGGGRS